MSFFTSINDYDVDFADVKGQENVKRALEIAAAGSHNLMTLVSMNKYLSLYPNPSSDIINIEIENPNNATIEIYNVSGRLVFSKAIDSKVEKIDLSGFPKGIYIVKVIQNKNVNIRKVVMR